MSPSAQAEQWGGCRDVPGCRLHLCSPLRSATQPAGPGQSAAAGTQLCTAPARLGAARPALAVSSHWGRGGPVGEKGRILHGRGEVELLPWS